MLEEDKEGRRWEEGCALSSEQDSNAGDFPIIDFGDPPLIILTNTDQVQP